MENYRDSDTSSESEYELNQGSMVGSDCDEDEPGLNSNQDSVKFMMNTGMHLRIHRLNYWLNWIPIA
jgi:hypothetical protein